jgi:medium-chain acyl-[acyl-carrier-protein] hydrolase
MTGTKATFPWLACHRPNPRAALRLFCFPYAGGGAPIYRNWVERLPPEVEVCPVQLPGRGGRLREKPFSRMAPLAEALAAELRAYLDKPFAFFGHSMGAIIGFEVARVLRREGAPRPRYLFASGRAAPQIPRPDPPTYELPEAEFIEELRRLNGTPAEVLEHPELMQVMLPLVRADFELIQTYDYTPGPPLDCPISAAGGLEDEGVSREQLEAWREQTAASFTLRMYPGDHFFIHSAQPQLLRMLAQELAQGGLLPRA